LFYILSDALTMTNLSQTVADAAKLLELGDDHNLDSVQTAFRAKAKAVHPDLDGGSDEALRRLITARDVLLENLRRQALSLDRFLPTAVEAELLTIDLDQAIHGGEINHIIGTNLGKAMSDGVSKDLTTRNSLKIKLPKGLRNEDQLRVKSHAPDMTDYVFRIRIDGTETCRAWGDDLWMTAHIDLPLFYYGGSTEIETPRGMQKIEIAPDTARGASLTIKGMGLPHTPTRQAGDLIIRLEARTRASKPASALLSEFQRAWA